MTLDDLKATYEQLKTYEQQYNDAAAALSALVEPVKPAYFQTTEEYNSYVDDKMKYDYDKKSGENEISTLAILIKDTRSKLLGQIPMSKTWFMITTGVWVSDRGNYTVDPLYFFETEDPANLPPYSL